MKTFLAVLVLSAVPAAAFAVFSNVTVPEPGALDLIAIGGAALVVARLLKKKK